MTLVIRVESFRPALKHELYLRMSIMNDDLKQLGCTNISQPASLEQVKTSRVLDFTWAPNTNTTTTIVSADFVD